MILAPAAAQAPAANTHAVATITPSANGSVYLHGIRYSFSGTPTGATLTVAWTDPVAGAVTETYYVTVAAGVGYLTYEGNSQFPVGAVVTITLSAVSGVSGTVYPNAEMR